MADEARRGPLAGLRVLDLTRVLAGPFRTKLVGSPLRFAGRFEAMPMEAPPVLGQHTQEVLAGLLGYDAARVEALREAGAVG